MQDEVMRLLRAHRDELQGWLEGPLQPGYIALLEDVVQGKYGDNRAAVSDALSYSVDIALDAVLAALHRNAWGSEDVDPAFWETELGRTLARVQMWLLDGDLWTISEAALVLRGAANDRDLVAINKLIARGALRVFVDPRVPNPQHARRVLRSDVWALQDAQRSRQQGTGDGAECGMGWSAAQRHGRDVRRRSGCGSDCAVWREGGCEEGCEFDHVAGRRESSRESLTSDYKPNRTS